MRVMKHLYLVILFSLTSFAAWAGDISLQVICNDPSASKRIQVALEDKIKSAGLQMTNQFPSAKLFVYAQQNTESRINSNGWSFAVAHVSNRKTYYLASKLINSEVKEIKEVKPALVDMVKDEGFMTYLNVIQTDDLSDKYLLVVSDSIVSEFAKRVKH